MVVAISLAYVAYGGLWWMQALFYAIGATVIAIIAIAAYKLARSTNKRDPLLWGIFAMLTVVTVWAQSRAGGIFYSCRTGGAAVSRVARLETRSAHGTWWRALGVAVWLLEAWLRQAGTSADSADVLAQILLFFTKAGAFVFGSGLAIIPFLQQGVVQQFGWLNEHQFLDAVAVAMITPGPVVITVAFIGFLVAGLAGAIMAAIGIFLPVYLFTIIPAPWFKRHRDNPSLRPSLTALPRRPPARSRAPSLFWARGRSRFAHGAHRAYQPRRLMALQNLGTGDRHCLRGCWINTLAVTAAGMSIRASTRPDY